MKQLYRVLLGRVTGALVPLVTFAKRLDTISGSDTKTSRKHASKLAVKALTFLFTAAGSSSLVNAQTAPATNQLPQGGNVTAGDAQINQSGNVMNIDQSSQKAIINWNEFNVGKDATVNFNQPGSDAATLNRVLDSNPSQIFGRIVAPGQVILINPNGAYFAPSASVDVGGLIATTHELADKDFLDGNYQFTRNGATGEIINEGELKAKLDGYIALMAPEVRNQGVIIAERGTVALASGEHIQLDFGTGNKLQGITVTEQDLDAQIENRHAIFAEGGLVILSARATAELRASVIKNSGKIVASAGANTVTEKGGRIILEGDAIEVTEGSELLATGPKGGEVDIKGDTSLNIAGVVDVSGDDGHGGQVVATADEIALEGNGKIAADGAAGGGLILIGGDWKGGQDEGARLLPDREIEQAQRVVVQAEAEISANATEDGDGGTVVVWSDTKIEDGLTEVYGSISVKEAGRGRGGEIETSGHEVTLWGAFETGNDGHWLIDPENIWIGDTFAFGTSLTTRQLTTQLSPSGVFGGTTGSSVTVQADNFMMIAGPISPSSFWTQHTANLTLDAGGHMLLTAPISDGLNTRLNLTLNAGSSIDQAQPIQIDGALTVESAGAWRTGYGVNIEAAQGITRLKPATTGGLINWFGGDLITTTGNIDVAGDILITNNISMTTQGGDIRLRGDVASTATAHAELTGQSVFEVPTDVPVVEMLAVGGGGSGGYGVGGGGGAGGLVWRMVDADRISYDVGSGGAAGWNESPSNGGQNTQATIYTSLGEELKYLAYGGGGGASAHPDGGSKYASAGTGGSGGGGMRYTAGGLSPAAALLPLSAQGNAGGAFGGEYAGAADGAGGGGGGAITGGRPSGATSGGDGGDGFRSLVSGSWVTYATGGGGAPPVVDGVNGSGGFGGSNNVNNNAHGTATAVRSNTGSGGGARRPFSNASQAGAGGVVVVRYQTDGVSDLTLDAGSGDVTVDGTLGAPGYLSDRVNIGHTNISGGVINLNDGVNLANNKRLTITNSQSSASWSVRGTNANVHKYGSGDLLFKDVNGFTGEARIFNGSITNAKASVFSEQANVMLFPGATWHFHAKGSDNIDNGVQTIGGLGGDGTVKAHGSDPVLRVGGDNKNWTFQGAFTQDSDPLELQKIGSGRQTLDLVNSAGYAGDIKVLEGTLSISKDSGLGGGGANGYGRLILDGGRLEVTETMTLNANRVFRVESESEIDVDVTKFLQYGNGIRGSGNITLMGDGVFTIKNATSNSRTWHIKYGTLNTSTANALGSESNIHLEQFGTWTVGSFTRQSIRNLHGWGTVIADGSITINPRETNNEFLGEIRGTGTLTKNGPNEFVLYEPLQLDKVYLNEGTFRLTAGAFTWDGGSLGTTDLLIDSGARLMVEGSAATVGSITAVSSSLNTMIDLPRTTSSLTVKGDSTFAGRIGGSGSVVVDANVTLTGKNTYAGNTRIKSGATLQLQNEGVLGATAISSTASGAYGGNIEVDGSLVVQPTRQQRFDGSLSGNGTITKAGSSVMGVTDASNFNSSITVAGGVLRLYANNALSGSASVELQGNAELDLNDRSTSLGKLIGTSSRSIARIKTGRLTLISSDNYSFAGTLGGSGELVKQGAGQLTLTGTQSANLTTTIDGGTVRLHSNTPSFGVYYKGSGSLVVESIDESFSEPVDVTATIANLSSLRIGKANNTADINLKNVAAIEGSVTVHAGGFDLSNVAFLGSNADDVTVNTSGLTGAGEIFVDTGTLTINQSSASSYGGVIRGGGQLVLDGSSTLTLTGKNVYTGNTTIQSGTSLVVGDDGALGWSSGSTNYASNIIINGNSFSHRSSTEQLISGNISGSGALVQAGPGDLILTGGLTHAGTTTVDSGMLVIRNNEPSTANNTIGGAGSLTIEPASTSFSSAFDFSDWTFASTLGGLTVGKPSNTSVVSVSAATTVAGSIELYGGSVTVGEQLASTGGDITINSSDLSGAGELAPGTGQTLTLVQTSASNFAGDISGTDVALVKDGNSELTLSGGLSYSGQTTISDGTLVIRQDSLATVSKTFDGSGILIMESASDSFDTDLNFSDWTFAQTLGGLTLGKVTNESAINVDKTTQITGGVNLYGGNVLITEGLISTSGDILIDADTGDMLSRDTDGVRIDGSTASIQTLAQSLLTGASGAITIIGRGGDQTAVGTSSTKSNGVFVHDGASVVAGGAGKIMMTGYGGLTESNVVQASNGVRISAPDSIHSASIVTTNGDIEILGVAGQSIGASGNVGVHLRNFGYISAGGVGEIVIEGAAGGDASTSNNIGIRIRNDSGVAQEAGFARITSEGGAIEVTGRSSFDTNGISLERGAYIAVMDEAQRASSAVGIKVGSDNSVDASLTFTQAGSIDVVGKTLSGGVEIAPAPDQTLTVTQGGESVFGGRISGQGVSLVKKGAGSLTLGVRNTYTGLTTVKAGTLRLGQSTGPVDGVSGFTPLGSADAGTVVESGATLDLGGFNVAVAEALSIAGTGANGQGALINSASVHSQYAGAVTLSGEAMIDGKSKGLSLLSENGITSNSHNLTLDGNYGIISGGIALGHGSTMVQGSWLWLGNNTFTGQLRVDDGMLQIGDAQTDGVLQASSIHLHTTDAYLSINGSQDRSLTVPITGSGTLMHGGTGVLTIDNIDPFNGRVLTASDPVHILTDGNLALSRLSLGHLEIRSDGWTRFIGLSPNESSRSDVSILPKAESFTTALELNAGVDALSDLIIGGPTNTSDVSLNAPIFLDNDLHVTARDIHIGAPVTLGNWWTNTGTVRLEATRDITQSHEIVAPNLALLGSADVSLTDVDNDISIIAGGSPESRMGALTFVNSFGLEIGEVNPTGIYSNGDILIETLTGNLTLSQNIDTTSTSATAVVLNAGKSAQAGTAAGGDIALWGTLTISVGAGGRATLYTGSISESYGLSTVVGEQSGHYRYNADEETDFTTTAWTDLGAGIYGVFREQPRLILTAGAEDVKYGQLPQLIYSVTGLALFDTAADAISGQPLLTSIAPLNGDGFVNAGNYTASVASGESGLGYAFDYVDGSYAVTPRSIVIDIDNKTKVYGALEPTLTAVESGDGLVGDDDYLLSLARDSGANVGQYSIDAAFFMMFDDTADGDNYSVTINPGTFEITPKPITVSAFDVSKTYGATDPTFEFTHTGLVGGDSFTGDLSREAGQSVGSYDMDPGTISIADGNNGNNYTIGFDLGSLTILKRPVSVVADSSLSKVYGSSDPELTYSVETAAGVEFGERGLLATDTLTGALSRATGETVGLYTISQGTLDNPNYDIQFIDRFFSIERRPVEVTVVPGQQKTYGDDDPAVFDYAVEVGGTDRGLVQGDGFTGALVREYGEDVGLYLVSMGTLGNSNYAISLIENEFEIVQRPITIAAQSVSKVYGEDDPTLLSDAVLQLENSTLAPSDILAEVIGSVSRESGEDVGQYALLISDDGVKAANYQVVLADNNPTFDITQRPVDIYADFGQSKVYGEADPELLYTPEPQYAGRGLIDGDMLDGGLSRSAGENAGLYAIGVGSLSNPNYQINFQATDFEIQPRPIGLTVDENQGKVYGEFDPAFTYTLSDVGHGDVLLPNDTLEGVLVRASGENVGDYLIEQGTLGNPNYDIEFEGRDFSITPRELALDIESVGKIYGQSDPELAVNIVAGSLASKAVQDGLGDVIGALVRQSGENAGTYDINYTGGQSQQNYALTVNGSTGAFRIEPKPITVSAVGQSKVYGNTDPVLTYGTDVSLVTGDSFSGALSRVSGENVGDYAITQNDLSIADGNGGNNYALTYVGSDLTITPRPIILSADAATKVYGSADPTLSISLTAGSLGSETVADTLGDVTGVLSRQSGEDVGLYDIVLGEGPASSNYTVTFDDNNQAFQVIKARLSLTGSRAYDGTVDLMADDISITGVNGESFGGTGQARLLSKHAQTDQPLASLDDLTLQNTGQGKLSNYAPLSLSDTQVSVTPRAVTLAPESMSKTYDGYAQYVTTQDSLDVLSDRLVAGDRVTAATLLFDNKKVGQNKTITLIDVIIEDGNLGHNYALTIADATDGVINPAPLTIKAANDAKFVTQTDQAGFGGVLFDGFVAGETQSNAGVFETVGNITRSNPAVSSAGRYEGVLEPAGWQSQNYAITYEPGDFTIVPADTLLIKAPAVSVTYADAVDLQNDITAQYLDSADNQIKNLQVTVADNRYSVDDDVGGLAFFGLDPRNAENSSAGLLSAGSYDLQANDIEIAQSRHFESMVAVGSLTVDPLVIQSTTAVTDVQKTYDGNRVAKDLVLDVDLQTAGIQAGDAIALLANGVFADRHVGTDKTVNIDLMLHGADARNYRLAQASLSSDIGTITQRKSVGWIGALGGLWSDSTNWADGVLPDRNNVAQVLIPQASEVILNTALTGPIASAIANNGKLYVQSAVPFDLSNVLSGEGTVDLNQSEQVTLSGANTLTGVIDMGDSSLTLANDQALGAGNLSASGGVLALGADVTLPSINIQGPIELASSLRTTGDQVYSGPLLLAQSGPRIVALSSETGDIALRDHLDAGANAKNTKRSLDIQAPLGSIRVDGRIGLDVTDMTDMTDITAQQYGMQTNTNPWAVSMTANDIYLSADVTTFETQTYQGDVWVAADSAGAPAITLTSMDPAVMFMGRVNDTESGKHTLNVRAITTLTDRSEIPQVVFNDTVGDVNPLGALNVFVGMQNPINPRASIGELSPDLTQAIGNIAISDSVTTVSDQFYQSNVMQTGGTSNQDVTLNSREGTVTIVLGQRVGSGVQASGGFVIEQGLGSIVNSDALVGATTADDIENRLLRSEALLERLLARQVIDGSTGRIGRRVLLDAEISVGEMEVVTCEVPVAPITNPTTNSITSPLPEDC